MENKKTSQSSGENRMTTICQEEENYVRMSLLLSGISPRAVRVLFDREFAPSCLAASIKKETNKLDDFKKKRIINQSQWDLLFPRNGVPDSNMFDITLMIALLTNLTGLNHYDKLPSVTDTTAAADLGRMKYYRNHIAHNKDGKLDSSFFSTAWEDIIQAVGRLGGKNIFDECKELKTKILEQSTVPWNIRVQISEVLEEWKMNNLNFVETRAANCIIECVQKNSCVTITGSSGVGKTATLRHVALQMEDDGYNILLITDSHDIVKFYNPNQKTLFVIDDFCGTFSINQYYLNSLELDMERIKVLIKNKLTKIVVACRLQIYQDDKFESLSIFRTCVCNLISDEFCLSQTEKQSIAELYLDTKASDIIQYCDKYDCFPLLCTLYNENHDMSITDFFKSPFAVFEAEIDKLHKNKHFGKYCALALCVIFNNSLKEEWLTDEINSLTKKMIKNTCKACSMDGSTSRLLLLDEIKSLEFTFIKKEQGIYKTLHDKIFDILAFYFGQKMVQCLIRNAHCELIMQRFLLERKDGMDQFVILVPPKYHNMYLHRMISEWIIGNVRSVFNNINMKILEFRQRFFRFLNGLDTSLQIELLQTCDVNYKDTVLLQCCQYSDIPWIQWCLFYSVDVNQCNLYGISPLHISAHVGVIEVVKLLLQLKADINKCTDNGFSPLLFGCQNNHIEVVEVLLENKADINKCDNNGTSPLYMACRENNIEVVKLLLYNKADIDKCVDDGSSPLILASWMNHIDIVNILLENNADINKCTDKGASSLIFACCYNHIEVVKILLSNKADINKCKNDGTSALTIASLMNYINIVKILLKNKADVNKCSHKGESPLYIACQNNHEEIAQLLLDNKADTNKCGDSGASPLYIACQDNHIDVVKLLLNNKADINKCKDNGASPLFIACQNNHIEIVKILMYNMADINKCLDDGTSPLFIACCETHMEVIKLLLDKKVDIDKCTDAGTTPLFIACQDNHTEVVKLLLDNKADINKCRYDGISPLHVACYTNHIEAVKVLLENKADIDKCDDSGSFALYMACRENNIEVVKLLLYNKADINKCIDDGSSPLILASWMNHIDIVNILLENNADINKCTDKGASPLFLACLYNHIEVVKILLEKKADINRCAHNGTTPLFIACQNNHTELVKLLLNKKADINKCSNEGESPLYIACYNTHIEVVKILLDSKADIDICTKTRRI